jgi:RNA polymerase sigma-70 factor (ECF subfamily)
MPETGDAASTAPTLPTRTAAASVGQEATIAAAPARRRRDLSLSLTERTDEELIALSKDGEEAAFGEFVRRHTATVHRWMARAVGVEDADDLTQEVFLKAYRGLPRFREEAPPRAWLASIADNAVKNRYRARGRFRRIFTSAVETTPAFEPAESGRSPEENARAQESRRYVAEALKNLPAEFRMPVVLRDLEEWSYEEIAVSLALPVGTVKSRISRGRGQLKALLLPLMDSGRI